MHFATSLQMCSCRTFLSALQKNLLIHPENQLPVLLSLAFLFSSLFQKGVFIMKVTIIHGQSHKGSTYHIAHSLAEKLCKNTYNSYDIHNVNNSHNSNNTDISNDTFSAENSITEFFLPKDFDNYCIGCTQCFMQSEKKCPHYEKLAPITKAIDEADVIILESPVYVYHVTGSMKAFLDHYGAGLYIARKKPCSPNRLSVSPLLQEPEQKVPTKIWRTVHFSGASERLTAMVLQFTAPHGILSHKRKKRKLIKS